MPFGPQVGMSGAFHFEATNGAPPMSGVHAGIFRPPLSPSASSSGYLTKSTGSLASDALTPVPNVNRKRLRHGEVTPSHDGMMNGGYTADDRMGQRRISGGREIRYTLGGQIETPNGMVQNQLGGDMESSTYSDVDYRRALGSQLAHDELEAPMPGQSRTDLPMEPQAAQPTGWSTLALNTIGGVVGKVWEFCRTGAFRGFYSGGGRGFDAHANPLPGNDEAFQIATEYRQSPTPGGFPESDYSPSFTNRSPTRLRRQPLKDARSPQTPLTMSYGRTGSWWMNLPRKWPLPPRFRTRRWIGRLRHYRADPAYLVA
ncbi:hypothetical protein PG994_000008 [Apiospora phragmitis]|uniref:Uncharacterized protein n=1 Tax=Apiospora phragmitis TaxID=2905665 RepID=A0ABR1X506_9PEZI